MIKRVTIFPVLFALILGGMLSCTTSDQSTSRSDNPDKLLLISFDGFRHDFLSFTDTPNFDAFIEEGIAAEGLRSVFPTKTFPNHYSIVTGLYPENSGLIANNIYDPDMEAWYRYTNREAVENETWYAGEPIWNTAEKQGLKAGTMFWVGSEAPINNMRPTYWKRYDGKMEGKDRIDTVVKWLSYPDPDDVDFATLYFELVDDAGHDYGLQSDSLDRSIEKADRLLGYLEDQLSTAGLSDINIIILSDHGLIDLSADKLIELDTIIDPEQIKRIVYAPVTMIQPREGAEDNLYANLKEKDRHYRVYRKEEIPEKYHFRDNKRVPEIIIIADPGYTILSQSYKSRFLDNLPSATHGYDNYSREMTGFFAARGPAFSSGKRVPLFQNIHLYELMARLLDIQPSANDGKLDSVRVLLQ